MYSPDRIRMIAIVCLAAIIGAVVGACVTYAVLTSTKRIPTTAQLKTVGVDVFSDSGCTVPVLQINWSLIAPGESKNFQAYIKNIGNAPITLTLSTESWNPPSAESMLALSWDYTNATIAPLGSTRTIFTLNASPTITGFSNFNFTIVITGTG